MFKGLQHKVNNLNLISYTPNYQICPEKTILVKKENAGTVGIIMVINTN